MSFYTPWMTIALFMSGVVTILCGVTILASGRIFSRWWKRILAAFFCFGVGIPILFDVPTVSQWVQTWARLVRWTLFVPMIICFLAVLNKLEDKNTDAPLRSFKRTKK